MWSEEEKKLLSILRPVLSTDEIEEVFTILGFNRSGNAIKKQARRLGLKFIDYGYPALNTLPPHMKAVLEQVITNRQEISFAPQQVITTRLHSSKKVKNIANNILDQLKEAQDSIPRIGSVSSKKAYGTNKQSLVILLSDWHYCHIVKDYENGIDIFNKDIAISRILSIPNKISDIISSTSNLKAFDEIVVLLAGDMITGEGIFEGQAMATEEHAVKQVSEMTQLLWNMFQSLREMFPLVRIITTRGNHGRTNGSSEANWDNVVYQMLSLLVDMQGQSSLGMGEITIKNRYGEYAIADIKGWKGMIRHHAPVQADTSAAIAKFASWGNMHEYDWCAYAHWHHWGIMTWNGKPIFRNGSLVGGDDYAERLSKFDEPIQLCWSADIDNPCIFIRPLRFKDN